MASWEHLVKRHHVSLLYAWATFMLNMIGLHLGWLGINKQVKDFIKTCDECQKYNIIGKETMTKSHSNQFYLNRNFGHLLIDCCGLWSVKYHHDIMRQVMKQKIKAICDAYTSWSEFAIMLNMAD